MRALHQKWECFIQSLLFFFFTGLRKVYQYCFSQQLTASKRGYEVWAQNPSQPVSRRNRSEIAALRLISITTRSSLHGHLKGLVNRKFNKGSTRVLDHQLTKNYSQQYSSSTPTQVFKVPPSSNCGKVQYGSYSELESVI